MDTAVAFSAVANEDDKKESNTTTIVKSGESYSKSTIEPTDDGGIDSDAEKKEPRTKTT